MFGVVDTLMFQAPAGVSDPDQVVRIEFSHAQTAGAGFTYFSEIGYSAYRALSDDVGGLQSIAGYARRETSIGRGGDAQPLDAVLVTASFFQTLGVHAVLGRFFRPEEERAEGSRAVVLGHGLWKRRFAGDRDVLGRTVDIAGQPCTVIGVAPPRFTGVDKQPVDAWLPLGMATTMLSPNALSNATMSWLSGIARTRPGIARSVVAAEVAAVYNAEYAKGPYPPMTFHAVLAPLPVGRGPQISAETRVSLWLAGVSLLVLLVACANVANLLLARAAARAHEVAVRRSLGAGRWRISRQLLIESVTLALGGAATALVVMTWSSSLVQQVLMPGVAAAAPGVSFRVFAFAGMMALGTGILCGLAPALLGTRSDLGTVLKKRSVGIPGRLRAQGVLVAAQVAFTVVLLAGAGLFVRSLWEVRARDLGMDVRHVLYASVHFPSSDFFLSSDGELEKYEAMRERVQALPGVKAAGLSKGEPFRTGWGAWIEPTTGAAAEVARPEFAPMGRAVSAGFFQATARRFLEGRPFGTDEHTASARVAIINEEAAHYYWGDQSPVGRCIESPLTEDACLVIVGVVANTPQWQVTASPPQELYLPLESVVAAYPNFGPAVTMEIRTSGDPGRMVGQVRRAMMAAGPDIPFPSVEPLTDIIDPQYRSWELGAEVFTVFGMLALALAAIGLYGVLVYAVVQRSRELGIRTALGAHPRSLVRMVVVGGLSTALVGAVVGLVAALVAGRFVAALLYGVSAYDPLSLGGAVAALLIIATLASYVPARRAARVDPLTVLRAE